MNPYLSFRGQAREAMEFYQQVFGGELVAQSFREFGLMEVEPAEADQIMHAQLDAPNGLVLMGSDVPSSMDYTEGSRLSISLSGEDDATLRGYWAKLSEGATVEVPLEVAPWGDAFGSLEDRFGVRWMVNIAPTAA